MSVAHTYVLCYYLAWLLNLGEGVLGRGYLVSDFAHDLLGAAVQINASPGKSASVKVELTPPHKMLSDR